MSLKKKLFAYDPDIPEGSHLHTEAINKSAGSDTTGARGFQQAVENILQLPMPWLNSNFPLNAKHLGGHPGLLRKWTTYACYAQFKSAEELDDGDPNQRLQNDMIQRVFKNPPDSIKSCFLNDILDGLKRLVMRGRKFDPPKDIVEHLQEVRSNADNLPIWQSQRIENDPNGKMKASELYSDYKGWCKDNDYAPKTKDSGYFGRLIKALKLPDAGKVDNTAVYAVKLKPLPIMDNSGNTIMTDMSKLFPL